jgi:hypothetical protein
LNKYSHALSSKPSKKHSSHSDKLPKKKYADEDKHKDDHHSSKKKHQSHKKKSNVDIEGYKSGSHKKDYKHKFDLDDNECNRNSDCALYQECRVKENCTGKHCIKYC